MVNLAIYPLNIKKYPGKIYEIGDIYAYVREDDDFILIDTAPSRGEAIKLKRELGKVKNLIYDMGDHYEVDVGYGMRMKVDEKYLSTVNKYVWQTKSDKDKYVYGFMSRTPTYFHRIVIGRGKRKGLTVDHINRNPLDNRKENLRWATWTTQAINKNMSTRNKSGYIGVSYSEVFNSWTACWSIDGVSHTVNFFIDKYGYENAKMYAIRARERAINTISTYKEALLVPNCDYSSARMPSRASSDEDGSSNSE